MRETLRERVGWWLRRLADRIDPANTPRITGYSFTIETGHGLRLWDDERGCPIVYLSEAHYRRAFDPISEQTISGFAALRSAASEYRSGDFWGAAGE